MLSASPSMENLLAVIRHHWFAMTFFGLLAAGLAGVFAVFAWGRVKNG